jgi:long-chain acyl-CoA synthetase
MKLSQGEYVALEKVENAYATCPIVSQFFVYGQSSQNHVVALLVPELPFLAKVASKVLKTNVDDKNVEEMKTVAEDASVKAEIKTMLDEAAKEGGLLG